MKKYSLPLEKLGIGFMPYLSLIVPVYNRPQEVQELLESLAAQDNRDFEVIIVEDGSTVRCDRIVEQYKSAIDIKYFFKENSGPGLSRNYGAERAEGICGLSRFGLYYSPAIYSGGTASLPGGRCRCFRRTRPGTRFFYEYTESH